MKLTAAGPLPDFTGFPIMAFRPTSWFNYPLNDRKVKNDLRATVPSELHKSERIWGTSGTMAGILGAFCLNSFQAHSGCFTHFCCLRVSNNGF